MKYKKEQIIEDKVLNEDLKKISSYKLGQATSYSGHYISLLKRGKRIASEEAYKEIKLAVQKIKLEENKAN